MSRFTAKLTPQPVDHYPAALVLPQSTVGSLTVNHAHGMV